MRLSLFFLILAVSFCSRAGDVRAGHISYVHLGGNQYKFRLYTWTELINLTADKCEEVLYIDCIDSLLCPRVNGAGPCPNGGMGVDGLTIIPPGGGSNGLKENIYESGTYLFSPGTHIITYIHVNRSAGIINLGGSTSQNIAFTLVDTIYVSPIAGWENNSVFVNYPMIDKACAGNSFSYNPGMIDPDGDSLDFSIIRSFEDDPGAPNCVRQITIQSIPVGLTVDKRTGRTTWNPIASVQGDYDISVLVKEYRLDPNTCGKTLVGQTILDFMINVSGCSGIVSLSTLTDTCILAGSTYSAQINASGNGVITPVGINAVGSVLTSGSIGPNASFSSSSSGANATGTFSWQPSVMAVRNDRYYVHFRGSDSSLPASAVYEELSLRVISPPPANFTAINTITSLIFNWNYPSGYSVSTTNPIYAYAIYRADSCFAFASAPCQTGQPPNSLYITTTSSNSYIDSNLAPGPHQYFVVALFADCAESVAASSVCFINGIITLQNENGISIFPTPAHGTINIAASHSGQVTFILTNAIGEELLIRKEQLQAGLSLSLEVSNLPPGFYYLTLISDKGKCAKKIIIN